MNKKFYWKLLTIMMVAVVNVGIASCGGSDDGDDNDNAGEQVPAASRFFVGNWKCENSGTFHYFTFSSNGTVTYVLAELAYKQSQLIENSLSKREGTWRYDKADEHSGVLYTTIDGFATIAIMNTAENYWNGITTGGIELTARKLADNDYASNHYAGTWVGCTVCYQTGKCQGCSGSGNCNFCFGTGKTGLGTRYEMTCSKCNGSGVCISCHGSGNCPSCGGKGGQTKQ